MATSMRILAAAFAALLLQPQSVWSSETKGLGDHEYIVDARTDEAGIFAFPGEWTPSVSQALEAKRAVRPASGYYVQYIGAVYTQTQVGFSPDKNGDLVIVVNGFCDGGSRNGADLTKSEVVVADGGRCYFRALYRLKDRTVLWFAWGGR